MVDASFQGVSWCKHIRAMEKPRQDEGQLAANPGEFTPEEVEMIEHPNRAFE